MFFYLILILILENSTGLWSSFYKFDWDNFKKEKELMIKENDGVRCLKYEKYLYRIYIHTFFDDKLNTNNCLSVDNMFNDSVKAFIMTKEILNEIYVKNINDKKARKSFTDRKINYELLFSLVQAKIPINSCLFTMVIFLIGIIALVIGYFTSKRILNK